MFMMRMFMMRIVMTRKPLFALLCGVMLLCARSVVVAQEPPPSAHAPADVSNHTPLTALLAGHKATVFVFLAEGCPICEQSTPELKRLQGAFAGRGVAFVAVFPNDFSDENSTKEWTTAMKLAFPRVVDTAAQALVRGFGARITPQAVVVLPHGTIAYKGRIDNMFVGLGKRRTVVTSHDVEAALEAVLKGEMPAVFETKAFGCVIEQRTVAKQ
jgi:thiol-disulfide isomerase/thioredoxin